MEAPPEDIVFPEDDGARTRDFSKTAAPAGGFPSGQGFEDEVSTAVYEVGDEIQIGPSDASEPPIEGDVFASPETPAFVDEVTKTEVPSQEVFESPPIPVEAPPPETSTPVENAAPEFATPFDEPAGGDEPEIEFMTDDSAIDAPPPAADIPPPSDRYVDRIVAPSPFAPRDPDADGGIVGWTDEDSAALADLTQDIVVDETSDTAIEVPVEEIEYDLVETSAASPDATEDHDPHAEPEPEPAELVAPAAIENAEPREVAVRAEDNQLHLRLQGTGAIIESGQVRELDIEVPVPGAWVGHRRVTLQLRLTLTPDSEEENGGSGETS